MMSSQTQHIPTSLGRLQVRCAGSGPPAILWHSLFVDSTSWAGVVDDIATRRAVFLIDGPCHGGSEALDRDFTFPEVIDAAITVLDHLEVTAPADWVGNAWGGHVGIGVAAAHPDRIRTLTTIGTPLRGLSAREKWTMCWPLVQLYRALGPTQWLTAILTDKLIGAHTADAHPDRAHAVMAAFVDADRQGMFHAMNSMMLHRNPIDHQLADVRVPLLMLAAQDDTMGCSPADLTEIATAWPHVRTGTVAGSGHVAPLLLDTATIVRQLDEVWTLSRTTARAPAPPRPRCSPQ